MKKTILFAFLLLAVTAAILNGKEQAPLFVGPVDPFPAMPSELSIKA
jgi:hypothetical protein